MNTTNCEYIVGGFKVKQYNEELTKDMLTELFNTNKTERLKSLYPTIEKTIIDKHIQLKEQLPPYTYDLVRNNIDLLLNGNLNKSAVKELVNELNTLSPVYNQLFIDNPDLYQYGSKQELYAIVNNEEIEKLSIEEIKSLLQNNPKNTVADKLAHIDKEAKIAYNNGKNPYSAILDTNENIDLSEKFEYNDLLASITTIISSQEDFNPLKVLFPNLENNRSTELLEGLKNNNEIAVKEVLNLIGNNSTSQLKDTYDRELRNKYFSKGNTTDALTILEKLQLLIEEKERITNIQSNNKFKDLQDSKNRDKIQDTLFQVKNIFNSVNEIESKLITINKTANSIGSNKNLEDVLKKAGLEYNLRKDFIQLLEDNKSLKSLKLSEVLSSYLKEFIKESDRQYYKAIDEPLSEELENILIKYFDKFHIRKQELDNLKEKFGVDSIGIFDVLAKTIYYSKNRNLLTLPEEYGHVFIELLGSIGNKKANNPLFKYLFDNIDFWDGYQRVYRDYKNIYVTAEGNTDIYKIKKEAIGQAIGIALVRNYKVHKGDKGFWSKIQKVIDYILNLIKGINYVSLNTTVDSIAKDILNSNYSKLDRLNKDTSNYNLLNYSETIKNQNKIDGGKALRFMQWFSQKGMLITGSLAYRLQGNVYRPEIDALHDIDNIVPSDVHGINLLKENFLTPEQLEQDKIYRKLIIEGNYKEAKKYKIQGNLKLNLEEQVEKIQILQDFKKEFPDTEFLYSFYNQNANAYYVTINAIWSENQELKNRFKSYSGSFNNRLEKFTKEELQQIYLFDFFLRPETTNEYKKIDDTEFGLSLAHFNYAFYEKLNMMGRPKDAFDYQMWDYADENNILAPDFNDRLTYFQIDKSKEINKKYTSVSPFVQALKKIFPKIRLLNKKNFEKELDLKLTQVRLGQYYTGDLQFNKENVSFANSLNNCPYKHLLDFNKVEDVWIAKVLSLPFKQEKQLKTKEDIDKHLKSVYTNLFKDDYLDRFIIKDFSANFINFMVSEENEHEESREQFRQISENDNLRKQAVEQLQNEHKKNLLHYKLLIDSDNTYSLAFKINLFYSIIKENINVKEENGVIIYNKASRGKNTVKTFDELSEGIIANLNTLDYAKSSKSFLDSYIDYVENHKPDNENILKEASEFVHQKTEKGIWYKFDDPNNEKMVEVVSKLGSTTIGQLSSWCTANVSNAKNYISKGALYIYYSYEENIATIQINTDKRNEGVEIGGNNSGQALYDRDIDALDLFIKTNPKLNLKDLDNYNFYKKIVKDTKKGLTDINTDYSDEIIKKLLALRTYKKDNSGDLDKLKDKISNKTIAKIFNTTPDKIYRDVSILENNSFENLVFIGNDLNLEDYNQIDLNGFTFNGNDLYLGDYNQIKDLNGFTFNGNDLYLGDSNQIKDFNGFIFNGNDLYLRNKNQIDLNGFTFNGNDLNLGYKNQIKDLNGFTFNGNNLYLGDSNQIKDFNGFIFNGNDLYLGDEHQIKDLNGFVFNGNDLNLGDNNQIKDLNGFVFNGNDLNLGDNNQIKDLNGFTFNGNNLYLGYKNQIKDLNGFIFNGNDLYLGNNNQIKDLNGFTFNGNDLNLGYKNQIKDLNGFIFNGNDLYLGDEHQIKDLNGFVFNGNYLNLGNNNQIKDLNGFTFNGNDLYLGYEHQIENLNGFTFNGNDLDLGNNNQIKDLNGFTFNGNDLSLGYINQIENLNGFTFNGNNLDLGVYNQIKDLNGFTFNTNQKVVNYNPSNYTIIQEDDKYKFILNKEDKTNFNKIPFLKEIDNTIIGFYDKKTDEIVINQDVVNPDKTVYHELVHRFFNNLDKTSDLYQIIEPKIKELVDFIKSDKDLKEKIETQYQTDEINEELIAHYISDVISNKLNPIKNKTLSDKINDIINTVIDFIKNLSGLKELTNEQIKNLKVEEFADKLANTILKENSSIPSSTVNIETISDGDLRLNDDLYDTNFNGYRFESEKIIEESNSILIEDSKDFVKSIDISSDFENDKRDTIVTLIIKPLALLLNKEQMINDFIKDYADIIEEEEVFVDSYKISQHYSQFKNESFFTDLVEYYTGKKVKVYKLKINKDNISNLRKQIGHASDFVNDQTTLRYKLVGEKYYEIKTKFGVIDNGIHFSSDQKEGLREANIWFGIPKIFTNNLEAVKIHKYLYTQLRKIDNSVSFSGGTLDGTEISSKLTDLDYRIMSNDIYETTERIKKEIPNVKFDKEDIDAASGNKYIKLEYEFEGGKADIAIVPFEGYLGRVSVNHLAALMSDTWKIRTSVEKEKYYQLYLKDKEIFGKDSKEALFAKENYAAIKENFKRQVNEWFRTSKIKRDIREQYTIAEIGNKEFNSFLDNISENFDENTVKVVKAPLKSISSLKLKADLKYIGRVYKATDIVRATLIINNAENEEILNFVFTNLKNKFAQFTVNNYFKYPKLGYKGINISILTNEDGVIELQINTPSMIYLKENKETALTILGDKLYNKIDKKYNSIGGKGHIIYDEIKKAKLAKNTELIKKLEQQSIDYYTNKIDFILNPTSSPEIKTDVSLNKLLPILKNGAIQQVEKNSANFATKVINFNRNKHLLSNEIVTNEKSEIPNCI